MFRKLYTLFVLYRLLFLCSARGVAWELIDLVDDMDRLATVVWQFLVDALDERKEKMRTTKNL